MHWTILYYGFILFSVLFCTILYCTVVYYWFVLYSPKAAQFLLWIPYPNIGII